MVCGGEGREVTGGGEGVGGGGGEGLEEGAGEVVRFGEGMEVTVITGTGVCSDIGVALVGTCCWLNKGSLVESTTSLVVGLFSNIVFEELRMFCGTIMGGYPCRLIIVLK